MHDGTRSSYYACYIQYIQYMQLSATFYQNSATTSHATMSWSLLVHTLNSKGNNATLSVSPSDTIAQLKSQICEKTGILPHLQDLLYNGTLLDNQEATIFSYDIQNWARLILLPTHTKKAEASSQDITIKTLSGKSFNVQAKPNDTVEDICLEVYKKEGIPLEQQQLIYGGKVLDWDKPLDHYGIQRESALHVVCASSQIKVFLKLSFVGDEKLFPLRILLNDDVDILRTKIAEKFDLPSDQQQLYFNGKFLEKDKPMKHYAIKSGSVIEVLDTEQSGDSADIYIRTPTGKTITIECLLSDTIQLIKQKVYLKVGLDPIEQELLLSGSVLDNERQLSSYDIAGESTLHVILCPKTNEMTQIFIRTLTGKTITLEVNFSDTIGMIKAMIQQREGISRDQQNLLLGGSPVRDEVTVRDCNVDTESTFHLVLMPVPMVADMPVFVKRAETGEIIKFNVLANETVKELKEKIFAKEKNPVHYQVLYYKGMELMNETSLGTCGLQPNSKLTLTIKTSSPSSQFVCVRNLLGKNFTVEVSPTDKVKTLKNKISERENISVSDQELLLCGERLLDDQYIDSYNIDQESTLHLAMVPKETVSVETCPGQTITIEIPFGATVKDLKHKIDAIEGIAPDRQKLLVNEVELEDKLPLRSYSHLLESTIHLFTAPTLAVSDTIFVKNFLGKTLAIDVFLDESILQVKNKISVKEGVSPRKQRLLFQGVELEDDMILADSGIERESNMIMVLKEKNEQLPSSSDNVVVPKHNASIAPIINPRSTNIPVSASVVLSKYSVGITPKVIPVDGMTSIDDLRDKLGASLHLDGNRIRFFHDGNMLNEVTECGRVSHGDAILMGES